MALTTDLASLQIASRTAHWMAEAIQRVSYFHYGDTPSSLAQRADVVARDVASNVDELVAGTSDAIRSSYNGSKLIDYLHGAAWHADGSHRDFVRALADAKEARSILDRAVAGALPDSGAPAGRPRFRDPGLSLTA